MFNWLKKSKRESDPDWTLEERLVIARAELARMEQLPVEDFTRYPDPTNPFGVIKHGVDEKPRRIARQKGDIARLGVMVAALKTKEEK